MTNKDKAKLPYCFPAAAPADTRVLILGSFPGERSLQQKAYYAHPRNVFWRIMGDLFGFNSDLDYSHRLAVVNRHRVGIWDVLYQCRRTGSLDSKIEAATIVVNDFAGFFTEHPDLRAIVFNGSRAEAEFRKRVLSSVKDVMNQVEMIRMVSTSPAMAAMNYQQKREAWRTILTYL